MKQSLPLVFFGSGPVALASLQNLYDHFHIELVVTKPQQPKQKDKPIVLTFCEEKNLNYITVSNKNELEYVLSASKLDSNIGVVVDFGIIISSAVINMFPLGIINSHFSLLPALRGADPISFSILNGLRETGVSLMKIVPALDEGPLLAQQRIDVTDADTTPSLTIKLVDLSNRMLIDILPKYIAGSIIPQKQNNSSPASYTRKLTKSDGVLDWHKAAEVLEREIRAFIEWPKSKANIKGVDVIVTSAIVAKETLAPGEIRTTDGKLMVGTALDSLLILRLKVPGKSEMSAKDFINGYL